MCHQSIGLIARHLEAAGVPTIGFSSARSITARMNPPRSVFVDLPLGHTTGLPNDPDGQRRLLSDGLSAGHAIEVPGTIVDLAVRYRDDGWKRSPLSWSRRQQDQGASGSDSGDTRTARSAQPQFQNDDDRAAARGVAWDDQCLVCLGLNPEHG